MKISEYRNDTYRWSTDSPLADNNCTLTDFLENEVEDDYEIIEMDSPHCDLKIGDGTYHVECYGDGDFCHHRADITRIEKG